MRDTDGGLVYSMCTEQARCQDCQSENEHVLVLNQRDLGDGHVNALNENKMKLQVWYRVRSVKVEDDRKVRLSADIVSGIKNFYTASCMAYAGSWGTRAKNISFGGKKWFTSVELFKK